MSVVLAEIPYRAYWSTPFCKWRGRFSNYNSIELAAYVGQRELKAKSIDVAKIKSGILGVTVPQHKMFWGVPWLMHMMGSAEGHGPTISQACATGTRCLLLAAQSVGDGSSPATLVVTADRTSNGPEIHYPGPDGAADVGRQENWVPDNIFEGDPCTSLDMVATAENVAARWTISTEEQNDLVLRRYDQYQQALANDRKFQHGYMAEVPLAEFDPQESEEASIDRTICADEGVYPVDAEKIRELTPVAGGTLTRACQTHPADGNAGMVVCAPGTAKQLSADDGIKIEILAFGSARGEKAFMPAAPVFATAEALKKADLTINQMDAIKSHNPFAVNDIVFAKETGADLMAMNNYGCSLIYGHPQAPTALRQVIELIEELVSLGGGTGLFQGCAAGDSAMAVIIQVSEEKPHGK